MYFYILDLLVQGYTKIIPKYKRWFIKRLDLAVSFRNNVEMFWYGSNQDQYEPIVNFYQSRPNEIIKLIRTYDDDCASLINSIRKNINSVPNFSDKDLARDIKKLFYLMKINFQLVSIPRRLDMTLLPAFKKSIKERNIFPEISIDDAIAQIAQPSIAGYAMDEKIKFFQGLKKIKIKNIESEKIKEFFYVHLQKHAWVNISYYNEPPLSIVDLEKRLGEKFKFIARKPDKAILKKLPKKLKIQALVLSHAIYLKDYLRGKASQIIYLINSYLDESAKRFSISKNEIRSYSEAEIMALLKKRRIVPKGQLNKRKENCFFHNDKLYVGKKVKSFWKKYLSVAEIKVNKEKLLGRIACKGLVAGKALVVKRVEKLKKIKEPVVLVVPNTNPAYVQYLDKVIGIVAEEGGVTAHVSLIAREFKIPTVVGVYGATKILKDGDLVEVDAENGIVKVLKKL